MDEDLFEELVHRLEQEGEEKHPGVEGEDKKKKKRLHHEIDYSNMTEEQIVIDYLSYRMIV